MKILTKTMAISVEKEELLLGNEFFPASSKLELSIISIEDVEQIMKQMKGLKRHWDCIEKAKRVKKYMRYGHVAVGSCLVWSDDFKSQFGYWFNPPFEIHAWWIPSEKVDLRSQIIIDFALPGIIEKGINTHDEMGPFLKGREPQILAGIAFDWVEYKPFEIVE